MLKTLKLFLSIAVISTLSSCVTQNFENDNEKPVIENDATNNEMAMTRISLGMGYLKMGNTTQAKINLEKAKRFAPNLTQVYTAFAHYYDTVEEPELAIVSYERALSIDSEDADTLNNYGVFLCRQERYQAAEQKILKAISIPSYVLASQSYENLALCQLKAQNFEKTEVYFEKAISHNPSSASALLQMLRLQYAMSDYKKAENYLHRYEKVTRRFTPNALALAYKIYEKQNNNRIAKNYAGMLVKMFPNSYEANQYIINELRHIEADDLAEQYHLLRLAREKQNPTKRVVVLSPKKQHKLSPINNSELTIPNLTDVAKNTKVMKNKTVNITSPKNIITEVVNNSKVIADEDVATAQEVITEKEVVELVDDEDVATAQEVITEKEVVELVVDEDVATAQEVITEKEVVELVVDEDVATAQEVITEKEVVELVVDEDVATAQEVIAEKEVVELVVDEDVATAQEVIAEKEVVELVVDEDVATAQEVITKKEVVELVDDEDVATAQEVITEKEVVELVVDEDVATALEHTTDEENNIDSETVFEENQQEDNELPFHIVAKGESFFSISKKYNIYMYNLERWNDFKRTQILHIGDVIYLSDPKKPDNLKSKAK